jgi:hypothetical protein
MQVKCNRGLLKTGLCQPEIEEAYKIIDTFLKHQVILLQFRLISVHPG